MPIWSGAAFQLFGCQSCGSSGFNWIPALDGAFNVISPLFTILVIVVLLEPSALLNPKAICSLLAVLPYFAFPIIFPELYILAIKGADIEPWCVPCKSIPTFWDLCKLIVPLKSTTIPFFLTSSTTIALLFSLVTLITWSAGIVESTISLVKDT